MTAGPFHYRVVCVGHQAPPHAGVGMEYENGLRKLVVGRGLRGPGCPAASADGIVRKNSAQ
jgi:hypothetical protein